MSTQFAKTAAFAALDASAQLQQIVEHTSAAVFVKDVEGRYLFVNREFERLKGVPVETIVGRRDEEIFPSAAGEFRRNDQRVLDERRELEFEETVETAQGTRIYLSHKFPLFDSAGRAYAVCGIATDITDRKRSEEALRAAALAVSSAEGEGIFRELVRYLSEILAVDVAMIAVYADRERTRMRTLAARLDGKALAIFEYALEGSPCRQVVGRAFRFVERGVHPEFPPGTLFSAKKMDSYAALPFNDSAGQPLGLIAVMDRHPMRDPQMAEAMLKIFAARATAEIDRLNAVAALRDSEASYRAIFDASDDPIFVHDWETGAFLDVSPKAEDVFGYGVDELRHMRIGDLSANEPPYTEAEARQWIERAKSDPPVRFEWRARHRDGHLMWHEVRLKPATIAGQRRMLAFIRDITASREAGDALRASEEQYRAIFNASADALVLWNSRFQRVDANPAYERMYGYSRDEVRSGLRARDLPPEYRKRQEEIVARTLRGERCQEELETFRRTGERFPIEVRTIPIRHLGEPHVLAMIRDLTERRQVELERARLEAQLRQAQKMEAIGHLTGGIAHDFNNLLTSIMGYVTLAAERSAGGDAKMATYLEQASLSCRRARDLIQQMLTFSRGRRGEPRALALAPLVREAAKLLRSSFPATVNLSTDLDDAAPAVLLDPVQLEQVLMNLAINARDAIQASGDVAIVVRRSRCAAAICAGCRKNVDGDFVELAVRDSGSGITPEVQERMFEPFFTTKEVGRGSGMGLATVHGIVHEHGGHIVVESAPGHGATFRVLLPALGAGAAPLAQAAGRSSALPRARLAGRVAVIDDEGSVSRFMQDLLAHWGLTVTAFSHPRDALEALESGSRFDLVLTDQAMPEMTGLDFARAARALCPALPFVLYTGYGEGITSIDLERAGIAALVRKPIEPSELLAVIGEQLQAASAPSVTGGR
ncbi:MAG TPA: PAS domain S-box protein [Casimicrobiaceae bacterium]|nr:PAS domain S-box protein [Casimicrobiaceae bacterium]